MPSLVEGDDRQTVKRTIPKSSNKIHAVAIVKLYIAHPNRQRWTYSGLQGAAVLANDLVGNTYWIKVVDLSPANRGVIWDQEIYDIFQYNQDRTFFHSFELEGCMAGFSFADEKEAKQFKKKMDEREKNAHKNTKAKPFIATSGQPQSADSHLPNGKSHSRIGNLLHGHLHSPSSQPSTTPTALPRKESPTPSGRSSGLTSKDSTLDKIDPVLLAELLKQGLTKEQLAENADFIKSYVEQQNSGAQQNQVSPQNTGSTLASRRGPPPAPPPARRSQVTSQRPTSPAEEEPSPPTKPIFRAPPPLADAGKFAKDNDPAPSPNRTQAPLPPGPPPPPRPPKTPLDEEESSPSTKFSSPSQFQGERRPVPPPMRSPVPPPPPSRNAAPAPPARDIQVHAVPPATVPPPPLPPKTPASPEEPTLRNTPPSLPPSRDNRSIPPPPPPLPDSSTRNNASPPAPPPAPLLPTSPDSSRKETSTAPKAPPPPPLPSGGAPPPPPLPPSSSGVPPAPTLPAAPPSANSGQNRNALFADIRGGAKLKKVSESEKSDRSAAVVGASSGAGASGSGSSPAPSGADPGGMAGALAAALAIRKSKVRDSDDEDDAEDW